MFSRQYLFLSQNTQEKLLSTKVLIIGSGLGSQVAALMVRTGFCKITVADGDTVSISNLNRQYFNSTHLGLNKADSLKSELLLINPAAEIESIPYFLKTKDLEFLIPQYDYVINTIDFDAEEFISCHEICKHHHIPEIFPMNLGFGFGIYVFKDVFFKVSKGESFKLKMIEYIINNQTQSDYIKNKFKQYLETKEAADPQLGVGTFSNAAAVTTIIIKMIEENPTVKYFPEFYFLDFFSL